jgi:hypothetical protein
LKISEAQQKFDYYVVALIFTLLAASVQTAVFGKSATRDALELASWVLLLLAGLLALWRLEWMHIADRLMEELDRVVKERLELVKGKAEGITNVLVGTTQKQGPIDDQIANREESASKLEEKLNRLDRSSQRKYNVGRYSFAFGLCLLVASRAYLPLLALVEEACRLTR